MPSCREDPDVSSKPGLFGGFLRFHSTPWLRLGTSGTCFFFKCNPELGIISRCLYPRLSPPFKSTDLPGKQQSRQSPSVCVFEYFSAHILSELSSIIDFPFLTINVSIPNRKLITLLLNGIWMRHAYVSRASALQNMVGSGSYTSQTLQNSANNFYISDLQKFYPHVFFL